MIDNFGQDFIPTKEIGDYETLSSGILLYFSMTDLPRLNRIAFRSGDYFGLDNHQRSLAFMTQRASLERTT